MKDNFGTFLHISDPVFADPPGKWLIYNFSVSFRDDIENKIIQEIVKEAKAEGITDVVLLNKPAIIGALLKQSALKPEPFKVEADKIKIGHGFWGKGTTVYKCPSCHEHISRIYKHCHNCGQKLDWSEEE